MAGIEFWETVMGRRFYEGTVPALVEQLKALNKNLEVLIKKEAEPDRATKAVRTIQNIMFFDSREGMWDQEKACGADEIGYIANALIENGFGPEKE